MRTLLLLVLAFASATAITGQRSQFTRYRSWNSRTYPVWKDGDPRFRNCWSGGEVTFTLKNDAPTLTGAKASFTIDLSFPPNQTVRADGQVVWAQNCTVNGRQYQEGQAVYPNQDTDRTGVFPDGTPFSRTRTRKPQYVYVWKAWGRYWQVADGPSSSLSINTDNVPLGSYNMELVIYHCRGQDRFIPLGYASSVFTITDQVPFTISLAQVNDVNQNDQSFIQNQAIGFTVNLHDPSQYLSSADISFSWDFGDNSGTLISRERTVTHTYVTVGTFNPQVVLMASIPCLNPTAAAPVDASAAPAVVVIPSTPAAAAAAAAEGGDAIALDVDTSDATPLAASVQPDDAATNTEDGGAAADADAAAEEVAPANAAEADAAATPAEEEGAAVPAAEEADAGAETEATAADEAPAASVAPAVEETADAAAAAADETAVVVDAAEENVPVIDAAASAAPAAEGEEAAAEVVETITAAPVEEAAAEPEADVTAEAEAETAAAAAETDTAVEAAEPAAEVVQAETEAPADNVVAVAATEPTAVEAAAGEAVEAEVTENEVAATAAATGEEAAVPAEGEVEADPAQPALVLTKRQAPELTADCTVYRYGSRAASVDVVQGIESVEIVQVSSVVSLTTELDQNAVDVTIACQGSLPSEVCTVISDADCITPVQTICNAASPSPDCQMILRQFFNETGVFCLNVSLTNDVSLAVASARVNVALASGGSPAGTAATVLGVMVLACVVCCIGLMYRRFKQYQPLREDGTASSGGSSAVTSVPLLLWNLLSRHSPGESRPLLQGRIV
ncbi:premelanosome protein a [Salarias fasciatus]|uniref:premelanosome protein a n=1 Tax=Salarias fasciatus TaxID=181472 RepID=UPI0011769FC0|nr:melanocyte protein PMEL-like [Salarias fasciatus]